MPRIRTFPGTVATAATVLFGLEQLRVMFSSLDFVFVDAGGANPLLAAGLALIVVLVGVGATAVRRRPWLGVALLAVSRFAVQVASAPREDLWWSVAGVAVFAAVVPALVRVDSAAGVLVGVAADRGLMGAMGTADLTLQAGVWPVLIVAVLGVLAVLAASQVPRSITGSGAAMLGFGPWLSLELLVFGNIGFVGATTGWALLPAALLATFGAVAALAGALFVRSDRPGRVAGPVLVVVAGVAPFGSGSLAAVGILLGSVAAGMLLPGLFRSDGRGGRFWMVGVVLVLFAYFAPFNYPLGYRSAVVLPVAAGLVAIAALGSRRTPTRVSRGWLVAGVVLAMLPLAAEPAPASPAREGNGTVRVMTYNVHQGFAVDGRFSLEEIATVIEGSGADVVALQEVSRGWVTDGEVDMAAWLSRRLGMSYVAGPTADRQWGNALLSRYPIVAFAILPLPRPDLPLRRGYVDATLDVGGSDVRVLVTHFDHVDGHDDVRAEEAAALVEAWNGTAFTVLAGDLNSTPNDEAMRILRSAGLVDVGAASAIPTSPAESPSRRIDYVWVSPDVTFGDVTVIETTVSDHLPVVITLGD